MQIWVDADACPGPIKQTLFRAAQRTGIELTLLANHGMQVPTAPNIRFMQVEKGFDVADDAIVQRAQPGDLVITADIPLAAEVIALGALALVWGRLRAAAVPLLSLAAAAGRREADGGTTGGAGRAGHARSRRPRARSEERRVGKEGRSRWSPYH